jgi:hypothetical protein
MKSITSLILASIAVLVAISTTGCFKDDCTATRTYTFYKPIYVKVDEIRNDIQILEPRELKNPGKIYFYDRFVFVNEFHEGIHIIDNANPSSPLKLAFISIPGNVDMAVKDNYLYADNYIDLLTIDITNPTQPLLVNRTENVFNSISQDQNLGHLVYYEPTLETVTIDCNDPRAGYEIFYDRGGIFVDRTDVAGPAANGGTSPTGIGGSLARFTLYDNYLYTVDEFSLKVFDINTLTKPNLANTVNIGWGIETIFPFKDKLFIGSQTGMFIFDNSNPLLPVQLSKFEHARACDPVFVDGDVAYVTLRDGTTCQNFTNQLDVIDIRDLLRPQLIATHPMHHPIGLSVRDNTLYLCEDDQGLRVFDTTDPKAIGKNLLSEVKGLTTYDVIALPNSALLLVIGKDGLYQFDASDAKNLRQLSVIPVE